MRIGSYDVNKLTLQPARKLKRERKEKSRADSSCLGYSATSADVYIYIILYYIGGISQIHSYPSISGALSTAVLQSFQWSPLQFLLRRYHWSSLQIYFSLTNSFLFWSSNKTTARSSCLSLHDGSLCAFLLSEVSFWPGHRRLRAWFIFWSEFE